MSAGRICWTLTSPILPQASSLREASHDSVIASSGRHCLAEGQERPRSVFWSGTDGNLSAVACCPQVLFKVCHPKNRAALSPTFGNSSLLALLTRYSARYPNWRGGDSAGQACISFLHSDIATDRQDAQTRQTSIYDDDICPLQGSWEDERFLAAI